MSDISGAYIGAAIIPALIITVLFYFDHNVSSQLAQQPEFNLKKPSAYHYDMLLLGKLRSRCFTGFDLKLSLHEERCLLFGFKSIRIETHAATAALMTMMCGLLGLPPVNGVIPQSPMHTKSLARIRGQEHTKKKSEYSFRRKITPNEPQGSDNPIDESDLGSKDNIQSSADSEYILLQVSEQRGSGLFQSLAVGACLGLTPAIRWIPTAVLWGCVLIL